MGSFILPRAHICINRCKYLSLKKFYLLCNSLCTWLMLCIIPKNIWIKFCFINSDIFFHWNLFYERNYTKLNTCWILTDLMDYKLKSHRFTGDCENLYSKRIYFAEFHKTVNCGHYAFFVEFLKTWLPDLKIQILILLSVNDSHSQ